MNYFVYQGQKFTVSHPDLAQYISGLQRHLSFLSDKVANLSKEFDYARRDYFDRTKKSTCPTAPCNVVKISAPTVTVNIKTEQLTYCIEIVDPKLECALTAVIKTNTEGSDLARLARAAQSFIVSTHESIAEKEESCLRYTAQIDFLRTAN